MPRIPELPQSSTALNGSELVVAVKNNVTEQRHVYEIRSKELSTNDVFNYYITLASGAARVAVAQIKLFNGETEIDPSEISGLSFARGTETNLVGTLVDLFSGDPTNVTSWDSDPNFVLAINVAFSSTHRITSIAVTACDVDSGISTTQAPLYTRVDAGTAAPLYYYEEFNVNPWAPGQTRTLLSPPLIQAASPLAFNASSIVGPTGYNEIYTRGVIGSIGITSPFLRLQSQQDVQDVDAGGPGVVEGYSTVNLEFQTHKSHSVVIFDDETTMDESWLSTNANYAANIIVLSNQNSGGLLHIVSSVSIVNQKYNLVGVKRTILNASAFSVNVVTDGFTTNNAPGGFTLAAGAVKHYVEYAEGSIFLWD